LAYIGNTPAENYASFLTETFTVSATTNYTLSHAVANENDIRLVINGVVQQPGSGKAYTASGTTLTLTSATASGDSMYAVYLGRALQTVNPPNASVGNSQTAPTIITGQTAETSIATDDTILIHDTSASALKKMTRANFVSGIGGTNTPIIYVKNNAASLSNNTTQKLTMNNEIIDTASAFASSKFTVPSGQNGKYYINLEVETFETADTINTVKGLIYKNGSVYAQGQQIDAASNHAAMRPSVDCIVSLVATDYIEFYIYVNGTDDLAANTSATIFKLIE